MKFTPEKYRIEDRPMHPFIDVQEIEEILTGAPSSDKIAVKDVIEKALSKQRLSLYDTAVLLNAGDPDLINEIKEAAFRLKEKIYGNRIVLFAPLYVGNKCVNNCSYCGYRAENVSLKRTTLYEKELIEEVEALEENGQKRLILVFGEHPDYNADFIANAVRTVYKVKKGKGEIRRVNINAAPLDIEGFRKVKEAGIGTYQIFQETYHPEKYKLYHRSGLKSNYENRLISLDKAQEAGLDDVGIGALFGLYDWKFEVMGLVRHVNHLEACYNVGPHTISFPRLKEAAFVNTKNFYDVSDNDFSRLIAILRLAVPYTGLILTAREPAKLRSELLRYGVSQIDGGTKIEIGSYKNKNKKDQDILNEQFKINDDRSLNEVIEELVEQQYLPSFCTACYRLGRTGEHFMEFSVPGFIKRFCTPNAILTLAEYLEDYAPADTRVKGWQLINSELAKINDEKLLRKLNQKLESIKTGMRDLYF